MSLLLSLEIFVYKFLGSFSDSHTPGAYKLTEPQRFQLLEELANLVSVTCLLENRVFRLDLKHSCAVNPHNLLYVACQHA